MATPVFGGYRLMMKKASGKTEDLSTVVGLHNKQTQIQHAAYNMRFAMYINLQQKGYTKTIGSVI